MLSAADRKALGLPSSDDEDVESGGVMSSALGSVGISTNDMSMGWILGDEEGTVEFSEADACCKLTNTLWKGLMRSAPQC